MIGKKINRYKITGKIGEGGMGSVWRAEDPLLDRDVALKFLPDALAGSPDARKRFLREAKAASALRHPGIATVFDAGEEDERIYIAFELVDGETVAERIRRGPLDVTAACTMAFEAAEALDHAHARGILHRDVTSRNIMIDGEGKVIVVDFGLALPTGATRVTHSSAAVGTPPYLAPEVITGGEGDERADVYGLGVVLYEMLTGTLPFESKRTESLFYLVVHTDAEVPSVRREDVPEALDRIVMKALSKDPAERYASTREFAKDVHGFLATASDQLPSARWLTAPPPKRSRPVGARVKNLTRSPVAWAVAAIVVLAVATGIWWLDTNKNLNEGGASQTFASVAVLPFQNLGEAPAENEWLAEGIAETLAAKLTSVSGVRVTPWLTSRNFGNLSRPFGAIADDLNVEALVIGTVRQFGERLLCTVTVVDAKTESQWWADEYEEPMDDLFGVQRRIALGVATSLKGQLSRTEKRELYRPAARSVEAYEHYLRGSLAIQASTQQGDDEALSYFERAVGLDADLADAYVGLGAIYSNRFYYGWGGGERSLHQALESYTRALSLEPASTNARRGLIRVYWELGRSEDVLKQGQEALQTNPGGVENLLTMGEAYVLGGLPEKAIPVLERVIELDPANKAASFYLQIAYVWTRRPDDAIDTGEDYLKKFGTDSQVLLVMGWAYAQVDPAVARLYEDRSMELDSNPIAGLFASALLLEVDDEAAAEFLSDLTVTLEKKLAAYPDSYRMRCYLVCAYGMKGDVAKMRQQYNKLETDTSYGHIQVAAGLARSGDIKGAADVLQTNATAGHNLLKLATGNAFVFPGAFFERPEVQPALQAMRELHDELSKKY